MTPKGAYVKGLMSLWREAANEMAAWCSTSAADDYKKLVSRVEAEGVSFLTITLPSYAKDLEQALDAGSVKPWHFLSFTRKAGLPLFLGGFLARVFDSGGRLLDEPCTDSILAIRQLTLMFKKIELECSDTRKARALQRYIECEHELAEWKPNTVFEEIFPYFEKAAILLWSGKMDRVNRLVDEFRLWPKHGPGATAEGILGNQKFQQLTWPQRLEAVFPYGEYCLPNWRYNSNLGRVQFIEPGTETPTRVVLVPKTLKTPRVIAVEPVAMQYAQQAVSDAIVHEIDDHGPVDVERQQLANEVSSFVGFADQSPNQAMAAKGSSDGSLATLDLSEASDRVLNEHVELLFKCWPSVSEALQASRSSKAHVLDQKLGIDETIPLAKFASMGSATCFPVEAMMFTTIIVAAIGMELNQPLTRKVITSFLGKVRVYGDDLVVPVEYVGPVIRALEAFGLRVNMDKSFWTGKFRESCGGDYYDGDWVTPVYVRRVFPRKRADVQEILSLVSLRNQFYWAGMWRTAGYLDNKIRNVIRYFPVVERTSPVLGRESLLPYQAERIHPHTHNPLVQGYVVRSKIPDSPLTDEWALLKCLLKRGAEPFADAQHLERQGRPLVVGIKLRWAPPF